MTRHGGRLPITKACAGCGATYRPWTTLQRFCSTPCASRDLVRPPKVCRFCGAEFKAPGLRNYCSQRCGWSARAARAWADVQCLNCGGAFRRRTQPSHRNKRVFCSKLCSQNYTAGENHPLWRDGRSHIAFGQGWSRIAEMVRERDGRQCRRCGKSEAENGRRLPVDHIIPRRLWASIDEANAESNLVALCGSCHGWKTTAVEKPYLAGNVLPMRAFQRSLGPSVVVA